MGDFLENCPDANFKIDIKKLKNVYKFGDYLKNKFEKSEPGFAKYFWEGYDKFKFRVISKESRIQEDLSRDRKKL